MKWNIVASPSGNSIPEFIRRILLCLPLIILLLGGCLSRPSLVKESFAFAIPPAPNATTTSGPVLGIRRIFVAPPFDSQSLTYRTGANSYERDPYAGFLASPDDSLAEPLRDYLRNSGLFRAVTEPDSNLTPNLELEVTVSQLYGDFRNRSQPTARFEMRLLAFKHGSTSPVLQKDYTRNIPLQARTAAALVAGWNEALNQIITEAAQDLGHGLMD